MCYPNGGDEPTITDANLVLGRLPPALIGGGIKLNVQRARTGLEALAARLPGNLNAEQLAEGIIEIANWDQANAIRQMTIQRGIDPADFALLSFGGSGPAQSSAVMEVMGMKTTIVPPNPGNLSAFGLLAVDWRTDHIVTKVMHEDAIDRAALAAIYAGLERDAAAALEKDGIAPEKIALLREADLRYAGQSMEVRVPAPSGDIGTPFISGLTDAFHAAHKKTFGYNYAGAQKVELVNFCVSAIGLIDRPRIPEIKKAGTPPKPASRPVYFEGKFRDTPVFARALLGAGFQLDGPAIVEEFGSTTVVFPGQHLTVDPHGVLIIKASGKNVQR
jgi:N-methylhydantoinase A